VTGAGNGGTTVGWVPGTGPAWAAIGAGPAAPDVGAAEAVLVDVPAALEQARQLGEDALTIVGVEVLQPERRMGEARWIVSGERPHVGAGINQGLRHLGVAHDGGQDVVEVVRDAASECPDGIHFLRMEQLRLERSPRRLGAPTLRHVADEHARHLGARVREERDGQLEWMWSPIRVNAIEFDRVLSQPPSDLQQRCPVRHRVRHVQVIEPGAEQPFVRPSEEAARGLVREYDLL